MNPVFDAEGRALCERVMELIRRGIDAPVDVAARERLALDLFAWQCSRSTAIARVARALGGWGRGGGPIETLDALPGVPTDAFKTARVACFAAEHTVRTFRTSGTTRDVRGEHHFADTSLYTEVALAAGKRFLLRETPYRFVLLAEREEDAASSSLSFMLARFAEQWSVEADDPWMIEGGRLDVARARAAMARAAEVGERVAFLGATFAFVHFLDAAGGSLRLPPGSVVMPTGGFKGRSRELLPDELFAWIQAELGVARTDIVQEYGMTELSSQAYEAHADGRPPGRYVAPPWMVVTAVDPDSLAPLPHGTRGILRVIDLANVGSCIAIQTADLGVTHPDGFEVLGRVPGATPRGCARAIDALLSGPPHEP